MQIYNSLLQTATTGIDPHTLFALLLRTKTMYPKQISIFCLHDMLFCVVTKQSTQIHKIRSARDRCSNRPWF